MREELQCNRQLRILLAEADSRIQRLEKAKKDLKATKKAADDARYFAESVTNTIREPLLVLDNNLRIVSANTNFYNTFKVSMEETKDKFIFELGDRQWDIPALKKLLFEILPEKAAVNDFVVDHDFPGLGHRTMLLNAREVDSLSIILLSIEDITERNRIESELRLVREEAFHDNLTGLSTRTAFINYLTARLKEAKRYKEKAAVFFLDVDYFKNINDQFDHSVGDAVLITISRRLRSLLRDSEQISRPGGDEFIVFLSKLNKYSSSEALAKKIRTAISENSIVNGTEVRITVSIGIAMYPNDGSDAETLITEADIAMYQAKKKGRDRYQLFKDIDASEKKELARKKWHEA